MGDCGLANSSCVVEHKLLNTQRKLVIQRNAEVKLRILLCEAPGCAAPHSASATCVINVCAVCLV